jgi:hypothetical protein
MNRTSLRSIIFAIGLISNVVSAPALEWLDKIDDSLFLQSPNGWFRSDLSGLIDLEGYYIDQRPSGLLFSDDNALFSPRLSLFLDTRFGDHLYSLVQVRFDRGFDPGAKPDGAARWDEYLIRYTPFNDSRVNVQFGKFATLVGNWVPRHLSWDNPFITAPVPYENVLPITDQASPPGRAGFLGRHFKPDQKGTWLPVVWGPSYAAGAAVFGLVDKFEYGVEIKNAGLSSRPTAWDPVELGWNDPTVSGRVGYRPNAAWDIGASFSYGTYLLPAAESQLPAGTGLGDFNQITIAQDIRFAWRHWQFWAETFVSRFEVPNVGDADTLTYYLEAKYKFTPHLFGAVRWNQQFFGSVRNVTGGHDDWDNDVWRADTAIGYRFDRHVQVKLQYSYSHYEGDLQQGEQLVAGQLTIKF